MQAMRLLMPPAWQSVDGIDPDLRAFYEFYAPHLEPWDGPAGVVLTDGRYACCALDRNGLRPARYVITKNRHLTVASEIGVWDYAPEDVVRKGRMGPGQMYCARPADRHAAGKQRHRQPAEGAPPLQGVAEEGREVPGVGSDRSFAGAEPHGRQTLAVYRKMFNITAGGARGDHPRAGAR